MSILPDLIGRRFGRLVVTAAAPRGRWGSWWVCQCDCGQEHRVSHSCLMSGTKSCGCLRRDKAKEFLRENNPNWRGGKADYGGYQWLRMPAHPDANRRGYIAEHRLVMSRVLGRRLLRSETVHHKNGNRKDNRPCNLELFVGQHVRGQRAFDVMQAETPQEFMFELSAEKRGVL